MTEAAPGANPKPFGEPSKFAMPNFEFPKFEIPAQFRDFAERTASQAKEACERMKRATDEMTDRFEEAYRTATSSANDCGLRLIKVSGTQASAAFDYAIKLLEAKSLSEVVDLSTAHLRKQLDVLTAQSKELTSLAQKVATETAAPIAEGVNKAFRQAA